MADRKNKTGHGDRVRDDGEWMQGMNEEEIANDGIAGGMREEDDNDMVEDQDSQGTGVTDLEDAGRNDTNPKRARDEGEAEPAENDAEPSEKRRKTRSKPGSIEKPALEKNDGSDAARPQDPETEADKNRKKSQDYLQGIRTNWDMQLNDLVNQVPDHLLEKAITKDEQVDVKSLGQLYDLSNATRGRWRDEDGVQAELAKSLAKVTRHGKGVFDKAINEVHAIFATRKRPTHRTGHGPLDDHLSRRATREPRSDRSTSGPRSERPSNEPRADSTPRQPPNAHEPSPSPQHNESSAVQGQRSVGIRQRRRTPRIERETTFAAQNLRIALREQRLAEANVEVAKARYQEAFMAGHKRVGMDKIVEAEVAVTDAKGKVEDANTKLIELRESLDQLQGEKEGPRVDEME